MSPIRFRSRPPNLRPAEPGLQYPPPAFFKGVRVRAKSRLMGLAVTVMLGPFVIERKIDKDTVSGTFRVGDQGGDFGLKRLS